MTKVIMFYATADNVKPFPVLLATNDPIRVAGFIHAHADIPAFVGVLIYPTDNADSFYRLFFSLTVSLALEDSQAFPFLSMCSHCGMLRFVATETEAYRHLEANAVPV
jgi:hypothetical protein